MNRLPISLEDVLKTMIGIDSYLTNGFKPEPFPKYEILKNENKYKMRLLLSGYSQEDISISVESNNLIISHEKQKQDDSELDSDGFKFITPKQISTRSFNFKIAILNLEVKEATFENGILEIKLEDKEPVEKKIITIK